MTRFQSRADALAALIEARLGIRGKGLEAKLRRAGRLLPGHIRREAEMVVTAARHEAVPKLARMTDPASVEAAADNVARFLEGIDPAERRMNRVISLLATNAANLLLIAALMLGLLWWRGLI